MQAILSDIHGNLEALQAVLLDIDEHGVAETVCLGDLVGYGPDPIPCVELAMEWTFTVRGEHEFAAISDEDDWHFPPAPTRTILRFQRDLELHPRGADLRRFLEACPSTVVGIWAMYVHASPRNPTWEFIYPHDIYNYRKMDRISERFGSLCFNSHTHIPGIFEQLSDSTWTYLAPEECDYEYRLTDKRVLCNVGSVGQPRDGDPRASYVLFDGETIRFRRVEYNFDRTIAKIRNDDDYEDYLGDYLAEGR